MSYELTEEEQKVAVTAFLLGHAARLVVAAQRGQVNAEWWKESAEQFLSSVEIWMKSD